MNYAWEAVLLAEKSKKDRDSLRFIEAACPSPYIEVSVTDLNAQTIEGDTIEINPLYRFEKMFGRLFDKNITDMRQTRALLFDVCMHYVVQLDLREGLTKEDFYESRIAVDIQGGIYGEAARKRFRLFRKPEQKIILHACLMLMKSGNYMMSFRTAVTGVYPHACIYENNETAYELLVYLGADETDEERERAAFLREMFLPIQETVHFFYEHHFGVIDVDETMVVDEMVLF